MMNRRREYMLSTVKLLDIVLAIGSFLTTTFLLLPNSMTFEQFLGMRVKLVNFIIGAVLLLLWHTVFVICGLYNSRRMSGPVADALLALKAASAACFVVGCAALLLHIRMITPTFLLVFWAVVSSTTALNRLALRYAAQQVRIRGRNLHNVLIIGTGARAIQFANCIQSRPELGYHIIGFVDQEWAGWRELVSNGHSVVCDFEGFPEFLRSNVVDAVVMALPVRSLHSEATSIAALCEEHGIVIHVLSDIFDFRFRQPHRDPLHETALFTHRAGAFDGAPVIAKRLLDVIIGSLLLTVVSPVMLAAAILIKLTSRGPIFFRQKRVGLHNRQFNMIKFRTMVIDAEQKLKELEHLNEVSGPVFKIKNDPRITPVGRFLRKTSIDELPQLFNVVKGDMSLVGPRPLPVRDFLGFRQDWQRRRFSVRPGITCLWQVNGRSTVEFEQWMQLDLQYIDRWSLWLDLEILVKTIPAVLKGSGAA